MVSKLGLRPLFMPSNVQNTGTPLLRCWGSLSCTVVSPPETDAAALDKAVAGLRYGAVGVNIPSFVAYSFPKLSWGAYPGNDPKVSLWTCVFCGSPGHQRRGALCFALALTSMLNRPSMAVDTFTLTVILCICLKCTIASKVPSAHQCGFGTDLRLWQIAFTCHNI